MVILFAIIDNVDVHLKLTHLWAPQTDPPIQCSILLHLYQYLILYKFGCEDDSYFL